MKIVILMAFLCPFVLAYEGVVEDPTEVIELEPGSKITITPGTKKIVACLGTTSPPVKYDCVCLRETERRCFQWVPNHCERYGTVVVYRLKTRHGDLLDNFSDQKNCQDQIPARLECRP